MSSTPSALEMDLHDSIHRAIELLVRLHAAIVQPTVLRFPALTVRWFRASEDVPPQNRLMETGGLEDRSDVHSVVEEHDQRGPPVMAHRQRPLPAPWPWQLVRGEIERVQVGLRQIVASGHIPLGLGFGKSRQLFQIILLRGPGQEGS